MKKFIWGKLLLLALALSACVGGKREHIEVKILGTSDVHGALFPYDLVNKKASKSSLAQVYSYVEQQRKNKEVILLDNGDILQGDPLVYYSNFEKTDQEHICAQVMNFMGYDAGTVGNHDLEPGHAVYDKLNKEFHFPWLAANAVRNSDNQPYFTPYAIIEKGGAKIAVLGLITPAIPKWLPEKIWKGMHFEPMVSSAEKWMKIIQEKEKPDFIVGLFHSGAKEHAASTKGVKENASLLVAEQVAGFDMVICGHDHRENIYWIKNPKGEKIPVLNPKNKAKYISEVALTLDWDKESKTYKKKVEPSLVDVEKLEVSPKYKERFQAYYDEVDAYVSRPVGTFIKSISTRDAMFGDSPFIDLIQNIQLDLTKADISFAAPLSFDASIEAGELQVRDLFKLYRFENLLYTMNLTGKEVKGFLEFSYKNWMQQMKNVNDPLLFISEKNRLTTLFFNYDSAEGIDYTVDVRKPYGERISIKKMSNGDIFDENKTYKVALNSYRGNGGGNHLTEGAGISKDDLTKRIVNSTTKDLRFYLMKWIEKEGKVDIECNWNWKVIPEKWHKEAKEREYQLLYGKNE